MYSRTICGEKIVELHLDIEQGELLIENCGAAVGITEW